MNYLDNLSAFALGEEITMLCDDESDMRRRFRRTIGEDGPTVENPYHGPVRVFAVMCDPSGKIISENT